MAQRIKTRACSTVNLANAPIKGLLPDADIAIDHFYQFIQRYPDLDQMLLKAGMSRAHLRPVEYDDEIAQCIETRREALIATPWRLEPQQTRASKWINEQLEMHMEALVSGAFNALLYGYSVIEVVYGNTGGKVGIDHLSEKPFEWFVPRFNQTLLYLSQTGAEIECDTRKFLLTVRQQKYAQPYGEALLTRLYWPYFFKKHGRNYWSQFLELFGQPLLVGKVIDQEKFVSDVLKTGMKSALPLMPGDDVNVVNVSQGGEFERFEQTFSKSIQKLILGQTLTSDVGSSGSYAAAKVHDSVRSDKRNADIRMVTKTVQNLVNALCQLNGLQAPKFVMADDTGLELERAQRDALLVEKGVLKLTKDYLLDRYDFREGDFELVTISPDHPDLQPKKALYGPDNVENLDKNTTFATLSATKPVFTAEQQVIEDGIDAVFNPFKSPIDVKAIERAIRTADSPADLESRLAIVLQNADTQQFQTVLERALFAADILGYAHAGGGKKLAQPEPFAAPTINISAPMTVMMPEQPSAVVNATFAQPEAPVINIQLPEQPAPIVSVNPTPVTIQNAAPIVNVTAEPVVTVNHPSKATQTVERDGNDDIIQTITTYE